MADRDMTMKNPSGVVTRRTVDNNEDESLRSLTAMNVEGVDVKNHESPRRFTVIGVSGGRADRVVTAGVIHGTISTCDNRETYNIESASVTTTGARDCKEIVDSLVAGRMDGHFNIDLSKHYHGLPPYRQIGHKRHRTDDHSSLSTHEPEGATLLMDMLTDVMVSYFMKSPSDEDELFIRSQAQVIKRFSSDQRAQAKFQFHKIMYNAMCCKQTNQAPEDDTESPEDEIFLLSHVPVLKRMSNVTKAQAKLSIQEMMYKTENPSKKKDVNYPTGGDWYELNRSWPLLNEIREETKTVTTREVSSLSEGDSVTLLAKVVSVFDKKVTNAQCLDIRDPNGTIILKVGDHQFVKVQVGTLFKASCGVELTGHRQEITTRKEDETTSTVDNTDEIEFQTEEISGEVSAVLAFPETYCLSCKKTVIVDLEQEYITCYICKKKMKRKKITTKVSCKMEVEGYENEYNISHEILSKFLKDAGEISLEAHCSELENYLLSCGKVMLEYAKSTDRVLSLRLGDQSTAD